MTKIIETLKSFYGIAASIGVIIPGFSFFNNYAPPLFKGIAIVVSSLSVAVIVVIANKESAKNNLKSIAKHFTSHAIKFLSVSFVLTLLYLFLIDFTTIVPVDFQEERWQVGFDLQPWSLTPVANQLMKDNACNQNKETLLSCATVEKESVQLLWTRLSIYGAGLLLIILFTAASLCWSAGWTFLAKAHLIPSAGKNVNVNATL